MKSQVTPTIKNEQRQELLYLVKIKMGWSEEIAQAWYFRPNINFENMSPYHMVEHGMGKVLIAYIKNL